MSFKKKLLFPVALAAVIAGCASKTSSLGTESDDHSLTILSICGGGLSEGLTGKLRAEIQKRSGSADVEAIWSVKMAMSDSEKLQYAEFTKCALEMDKRIREGKKQNAAAASSTARLSETTWVAQKLIYSDREVTYTRTSDSEMEMKVIADGQPTRKQTVSTKSLPSIHFTSNGTIESAYAEIPGAVFFQTRSGSYWQAGGEPNTLLVKNSVRFPPDFVADEIKFKIDADKSELTLVRRDGPPESLKRGVFQLR